MEARKRCLIFDPFAGISGDMILAGLIDLGLQEAWLREFVAKLSVQAEVSVSRETRGSLSACAVSVRAPEAASPRHLKDVLAVIQAADLAEDVRKLSTTAFTRLAEVEGRLHGVAPDEVHFHEVGATDAIIDIVTAIAGVSQLGVTECFTRPVALGRGWISAAHGRLPLPAPATLQLLEGVPVFDSAFEGELTTPTGAVVLSVLSGGRRAPSSFVPVRSGFGAGSRDPQTHPNCLRLVLADLELPDAMCIVQADLDDMSPEYLPALTEALLASGAADVCTFPIQMKKGRTGARIELLVPESRRHDASQTLLRESTTLGLRFWRVEREVLPRATKTIQWRGHSIRIKSTLAPGGHLRYKPEYDDLIQAARATRVPALQARAEIDRLLQAEDFC